jgi:hypothetical protein
MFFSLAVILSRIMDSNKLYNTNPIKIMKPGCREVLLVEMLTRDSVSIFNRESW